MSCCDSGLSASNSSSGLFQQYAFFSCILFLCVCCVVGLRGCNQDRVFECWFFSVSLSVIWVEWSYSVLAVSWGFVRPSPPCLTGRAGSSICLSVSRNSRPMRVGINWSLMAFFSGSNNSLMSGTRNGSIWSIILWWMQSMLFEDHLVCNLRASEGLLPNPQHCF